MINLSLERQRILLSCQKTAYLPQRTVSAMAAPASAPRSNSFAQLQQVALEAAKIGAEVRICRVSILEYDGLSEDLCCGPQVVHEALEKPRNIHFKGVTDLVTDTDRASEEAVLKAGAIQVHHDLHCNSAAHWKPMHMTRC